MRGLAAIASMPVRLNKMKFKHKVGDWVWWRDDWQRVYQRRIYWNMPYYRLEYGSIVHEDFL